MTKKEKILTVAQELFAKAGVDGTSTSRIAKAAGVSEGLIFRHFKNKDGLVKAILEKGMEKGMKLFNDALSEKTAKGKLKAFISLPVNIKRKADRSFWRLMYALKWQSETYDDSMSAPIKASLVEVFKELKYKNPKVEAEALMLILDGLTTTVLLKQPDNEEEILKAVLEKYELI